MTSEALHRSDDAVVLVVPPVLHPLVPTLGPTLLAPACKRIGVPTHIEYAGIAFARWVGLDFCVRLATVPSSLNLLGEAIFWGAAFPERAQEHADRLRNLLETPPPLALRTLSRLPRHEEIMQRVATIPAFIAETVERILTPALRIVGFSVMGQQVLASIALAREIKRRRPDIITVLGGPSASQPMGEAIHAMARVFDFVFSGEADESFPSFCRQYIEQGSLPSHPIIECSALLDLDRSELPDYSDFLAASAELRVTEPAAVPPWLLFESSRGCWWADRSKCTFCGFNGEGTCFRSKSPARVVADIEALIARHGVHRLQAADNMMPREFPSTAAKSLAEREVRATLAYEVRPTLSEADLDALVRAGVTEIQPGIESLASPVLKLMRKGVRALTNVALLRDAHARRLSVVWNFLTDVPGDDAACYGALLELIPLLEHLPPPQRWGPLRISRYSPYYDQPSRYGISSVRPWQAYVELFGDWASSVAHHFRGEYRTAFTDSPELAERFHEALRRWAGAWSRAASPPTLTVRWLAGGDAIVEDRRSVAVNDAYVVPASVAAVLRAVHRPQPFRKMAADSAAIDWLIGARLVAHYEDQLLSLPIELSVDATPR